MKRLLTLLFFVFFAITTQAQTAPDLPPGSVPFGTGLFRAPNGDIWGGSKFDQYVNLGNWQRVADSLGAKINWSDTTIIASKEWVEGKLNSLPPSGVLSVTGDGVDNTDPANPVLSYPDPSDIGALAPGDNVSELTNDAGYLDSETDPVYSGDPASSITQNDIDSWDAKQDAITGAATTVVQNNLTPSRALISNGSGKIAVSPVSAAELAFIDGVTSNVQDQLDDKIPLAQKGANNGVAPIGPDGKVPSQYIPESGSYQGAWDASTNTPTIADGVGNNGDWYRVSTSGTQDLGSGPINFVAGDQVVYNGTIWERIPSGNIVSSVNGQVGDVVLDKNDVGLGNVDNTSDMDKPISNAVQDALDLKLDASEISNYYTKTQMQTSGQAQMHWDNITNVPGGLGLQTLSTSQGANNLTISGGNSVTLNNLYYKSTPNFPDDVTSQSSGFHPINISSGTGWPSPFGFALLAARPSGPNNNNGSFVLFKSSTNDNKIRYSTGAGETWNDFSTFASEEWVNSLPGIVPQTLSLSSNAGRISISGGNSVDLASVAAPTYSGSFEDFNPNIGLWVYRSVGGSSGYPATSGGGIRFNRNSTNNSGSFDIFKAQGTSPKLYYTVGLNGPWEQYTFASEEWVNSLPGLVPQTLSLSGENLSISGGNSVSLYGLGATSPSLPADLDSLEGAMFSAFTVGTSNRPPSASGSRGGIIQMTRGGQPSKFQLGIGNEGDIHARTLASTGWTAWKEYPDKTWVTGQINSGTTLNAVLNKSGVPGHTFVGQADNFSINLAPPSSGGWDRGYGLWQPNVEETGVTGGGFGVHGVGNNQINYTYLVVDTNNTTSNMGGRNSPGLRIYPTGQDGLRYYYDSSEKQVWHAGNLTPGDYLLTSSPAGSITTTDIDNWNSAFTPEDIGFGLHTDANGKLAWGTSIGGGTIGFKTDSLLFFANQAQTSGVLIGDGLSVAVDGEQTFAVTGTTVFANPSDVFRAVAGDNTGEQVASISAGRLTDPDRAIVQAHTSEGEGAFVNMSAFSGPNTDFPVKSATMSAGNASISVTNRLSPEGKSGFVYNGNTGNSKGIMEMSNLTDGNLLIDTAPGAGIILRSPNDTKYLLTVDDAGNLTTTLVP